MDKLACNEIKRLKDETERLKVEIGDLVQEKSMYKARLSTIEHNLIQRKDLFEHDEEFFRDLLRLTRTLV